MTAARASSTAPSVLFLDFDDVICLNRPYGGLHLLSRPQPKDLHLRLWHPPALEALLLVVERAQPAIVLTTTWLRFLDLPTARALFHRTNAGLLAHQLHPCGEAPLMFGQTKLQAIDAWIRKNGCPALYAILDDLESGTGLSGSRHDQAGRVFLCEVGRGLNIHQVPNIVKALAPPKYSPPTPLNGAT